MKENKRNLNKEKITRRDFMKYSAVAGCSAFLASKINNILPLIEKAKTGSLTSAEEYELSKAGNIIYSTCLQCHTDCPIKGRILNGVLAKIDGPAYSPQSMLPHIEYLTSPFQAAKSDGKICPKGQAGIQSLYDPYRIVRVLKRVGPRGSNKWEEITFEQAINEVVNGGYLFKKVRGEEKRYVPGLKDIFAVKDPSLMKALKEDAEKVAKGKMTLSEFKRKHNNHLDKLIDPNHPDAGPKNNQFVFLSGRIEHGRKEFSQRWLKDAFGSVNWYEHTTICEQSHHIAYQMLTNQYKDGKWQKGLHHMKPDILNSKFIIFFGTGAFEANFGPPPMVEKITEGIKEKRLKIAVIDPRFSKTAAKADIWAPIKPGTDAALALGMIRWIIEKRRYDERFLRNANKASVNKNGESSWTTATYLVKIEKDGKADKYLRGSDIGIGSENTFVILKEGKPAVVDPYDDKNPVEGELFVDSQINGIKVKSAFQLLKESAFSKTIKKWAEICGIDPALIEKLAREFTSYRKKACAELYRGAVQHTNGYYNAQTIINLNLLIGNPDWKGGMVKGGGHWHEAGGKPGNPFDLKKLHPGKLGSFGIRQTREKSKYEETTYFKEYPAKRPFYPFTSNVYQEVLPSAKAGYPYKIKVLFLHKGTPALSVPDAQSQINVLLDLESIPLFFACDIVIGESSMYADYIFPDLSVWERWGTPHLTPDVVTQTSKVRQPMVAPLTKTVTVFGEKIPICMESIMLAIAEKLGLPGYGKDGFGKGMDFKRMEDFYLKMVANIAFGDKKRETVPNADNREVELFLKARSHLTESVFNPEKWKKSVGEDKWRKVIYVLNRGGRYEDFKNAYNGNYVKHKFAGLFSIYVEPVALAKNSITGKSFSGVSVYEEIKDASGKPIKQDGYEFSLITYKDILGGQSRTLPTDYWLSSILPENYILINTKDAKKLKLKDGDKVRIVSKTNREGIWDLGNGKKLPVEGKIKITEGMRPGTIAISWHFGHWAYGSSDMIVNGKIIKGDERRKKGLCPNVVLLADPYLKDVCLTDPIGGSSSFYDTKVNLIKV